MDPLLLATLWLLLVLTALLGVCIAELFTPLEYRPLTARDLDPERHNRSSWTTPEDDPAWPNMTETAPHAPPKM